MKLEFIELPFLNIGKSGKIRTGAGFNSSDFKTEGVPLIKIGNIKNNQIDISDCSYISENEKKINLTRENDLLIAMRGATSGKLGIVSKQFENCFYVGSIGNLGEINDELIYRPFIKYIEQQLYEILKTESKGTATPMVSIGMLEKFKLVIPKTKEQQKYLFELLEKRKNQVGELTTELTHQLTLVKKLRQQLLQDAVQGKLVEQNPKDEPASELLKKIKAEKEKLISAKKLKKEKELPPIKPEEIPFEIPENWVWCRFQEITALITCGLASTPKYYSSGRIFLSAKNVKPFRFMPEEHKFVDEETYRKVTQNAKPELHDILVTRVGAGIGETAIIDKEIDFAFYVSLTLIKPFKGFIDPMFLTFFLNSPQGINNAVTFTTGVKSSQGNLNVDKVRKFLIPLPPLEEQTRIVQKLDELMQYCNELEASIKQSESQNEKLLQQVLREALRKEPVEA